MRWVTLATGLAMAVAACGEGSGQKPASALYEAMDQALISSTSPQGIRTQRLYSGDDIIDPWRFRFSADGRYEVFSDWNTNEGVAVRDLETGEIRNLTPDGSGQGFAYGGAFSSDGRRIAYNWHEGHQTLTLVNMDGSDRHTLLELSDRDIIVMGWSPDDSKILVGMTWFRGTRRPERSTELAFISAAAGTIDQVVPLPEDVVEIDYGQAFLSPDGRSIAYSALRGEGSGAGDVAILDSETGRDQVVLDGPANDKVLGWSGDGAHVYVVSERSGNPSIWAIPVREGRATETPVLVRRDVHGFFAGQIAAGKLLYYVAAKTPELFTVDIDPSGGEPLSEPTPVETTGLPGDRSLPAWSPDGESLAYVRGTPAEIVVRAARDGNHVQVFSLPGGFVGVASLRWSPDSRTLLLAATPVEARESGVMMKLHLDSGEFELGLRNPAERGPVTHDGERGAGAGWGGLEVGNMRTGDVTFPYQQSRPEVRPPLPQFAPAGDVCTMGGGPGMLSPSDDRFAFTSNVSAGRGRPSCLGVVPLTGGEVQWLYRGTAGELKNLQPVWTADGQAVLFVKETSGPLDEIWMVPAVGGEARRLFAFEAIEGFGLHPDRDRLVIWSAPEAFELWVMDGLDEAVAGR